jgi:hypothetical protein
MLLDEDGIQITVVDKIELSGEDGTKFTGEDGRTRAYRYGWNRNNRDNLRNLTRGDEIKPQVRVKLSLWIRITQLTS